MIANKLIKKYKKLIIKFYAAVKVPLRLIFIRASLNLIIFRIQFVPGTTEKKIMQYLGDVRQALKLQLFQMYREGKNLYFVVARQKIIDNRLMRILTNPGYRRYTGAMKAPYPIGFNAIGNPVVVDMAAYIHWLLSGSSNSGKTIGVKCLLTGIVWSCSPEDVNLIIFDGASNLMQFNGLQHLSCPVIQDSETGFAVIGDLFTELERRIVLRLEDIETFNRLPIIICVLDEFASFVSGIGNKHIAKQLTALISQLLRRGRHGKIHLVLAAQDPAKKEINCDISNITARIAFTCAKSNYSMTILGESGAHRLSGEGEMYFRSPKHTGLMYIKGANISDDEINAVCDRMHAKYDKTSWDDSNKFTICSKNRLLVSVGTDNPQVIDHAEEVLDAENKLIAEFIMLALKSKTFSALHIIKARKMGWPRANAFLERLYSYGIVGAPHGRQARTVLPVCIEDLSPETLNFLYSYGYSDNQIVEAFKFKDGTQI